MAGPSLINSACNCCIQPAIRVWINYVSAAQSCSLSTCGEQPCSTRVEPFLIECTPNFEDLSRLERCSAKYLTVTVTDSEDRSQIRQYTVNEDGSCTLILSGVPGEGIGIVTNVQYTNKNEQIICTPNNFPNFPDFWEQYGLWEGQCTSPDTEPLTFPEYEEGQGREEEAYKYENPNFPEEIKSEQKIKYRVEHHASASCYLKVWFRKKIQNWRYEDCDTGFTDPQPSIECDNWGNISFSTGPCSFLWIAEGNPIYEDIGTYEWQGSGYPCYENNDKPQDDCVNTIKGEEENGEGEIVAGTNQSVTIEIKYSQVKDYEPNWPDENGSQGCNPNNFPIPNPEDCPEYNP
jgi:hypothetical protein